MFLLAARPEGGESFVLLRVLREAFLPGADLNDHLRLLAIEASSNSRPWASELDEWTRDRLSLHGIECRVLGTFIDDGNGSHRYAEDIADYYSVHGLMAWKPGPDTLSMIVNHRGGPALASNRVGVTRFAAAEGPSATRAGFFLDPADMLRRRTVYLGMSRSGKSNGLKVLANCVYMLRGSDPSRRVGQLIFDASGEYARDNPQDGKALHRAHEPLGLPRDWEVATYGLVPVPWDPSRKVMKVNFYGGQLARQWDSRQVESAVDQVLVGQGIVREILAGESSKYIAAFRDADLSVPPQAAGYRGPQVRYRRALLAYQAALFAAGLTPPIWHPWVDGLFSQDLVDALSAGRNPHSPAAAEYDNASSILRTARAGGGRISWDQLLEVFTALNHFMADRSSAFAAFNQDYMASPLHGAPWADSRLENLLCIFDRKNGPRSFQTAEEQHDPHRPQNFAGEVVEDLAKGKLVIIDQSVGGLEQNQAAAERVMWEVYNSRLRRFSSAGGAGTASGASHVLVYLEEAHNLLPSVNARDNLRTVWAKAAKEGSKLGLGMVLSTQAPSSVMPEVLSETDNWVLSYLPSRKERDVIAGYMDFSDFVEQIGRVSEPGFVWIKTLSRAYTVPVQLDRFRI